MSRPIKTLIADDEEPGRRAIKDLLRSESDIMIIGEAADGLETVNFIQKNTPDLVFLDIQMPGLDGFDVIRSIGIEKMPMVVFVTVYHSHALNAFDVNAIDYVLKPIHPDRFQRIRRFGAHPKESLQNLIQFSQQTYPKQIVVRADGKLDIVKTDSIRWIAAQGDYVEIHTRAQTYLMRETLTHVASLLDPTAFQRVHRSTIIALRHIKSLEPLFNGDHKIILDDGSSLTLSRTYHEKVIALLAQT